MTATKGLGTYGDGVGVVTPLDHKMAQLGLIVKTAANTIRSGLFWDGSAAIVSGKANMSYDVRAFTAVLSRGSTAGAVLLTNDAVYNIDEDVDGVALTAPGSNSRYDVIFVWQREFSIDGTDSVPVIGVLRGTASASPSVPSLADYPGAIELARVLVPAGTTATNSGTTITQKAKFTAAAGGMIPFRNTAERDEGTYQQGQLGWLMDSQQFIVYSGSTWLASSGESFISNTPFSGTTVTIDGLSTLFTGFRFEIVSEGTAATLVAVLRTTAPADETAAKYDRTALLGRNVTPETSTPVGGTSWGISLISNTSHHHRLEVEGLTQARPTTVLHLGGVNAATAVQDNTNAVFLERLRHRDSTIFGGIKLTFSAPQTGYVRTIGKL